MNEELNFKSIGFKNKIPNSCARAVDVINTSSIVLCKSKQNAF